MAPSGTAADQDGLRPPTPVSEKPARVLSLIKGLGPGGAERLLVEQAAGGDRERFQHEVAYVLDWKRHLVPELEALGVRTHCLGVNDERDPRWATRLAGLLRTGALRHRPRALAPARHGRAGRGQGPAEGPPPDVRVHGAQPVAVVPDRDEARQPADVRTERRGVRSVGGRAQLRLTAVPDRRRGGDPRGRRDAGPRPSPRSANRRGRSSASCRVSRSR